MRISINLLHKISMHYFGQQKKSSSYNMKCDNKAKGAIIILGENFTDTVNSYVKVLAALQWRDSTIFLLHFQLQEKLSTWKNLLK